MLLAICFGHTMVINFYDYLCKHYFEMKIMISLHTLEQAYVLGHLIVEVRMFVFCITAIRSHFEYDW